MRLKMISKCFLPIMAVIVCCYITKSDTRSLKQDNDCEQLPALILTEILGAAYNSRYMSITEPNYTIDDVDENSDEQNNNVKRKVSNFPPFYVDDTYALELSDKPAWEMQHVSVMAVIEGESEEQNREKRSAYTRRGSAKKSSPRPWECEAKVKWIDLGPEYFPRFLRTVECTKHLCWYGHYTCKPRSFTVKILRRRRGECVVSNSLKNRISVDDLPNDLRELWVWEERAVNFCCDCAAP